jgi:hypothetical protein
MADPWLKFYPTDWRSDPALRMCSPAARGLWIDMICLMHEASPYGHLLINGHCPTDAQLAVLTGTPSDQFPDLVRELETAGVFSRTKEGVIYSRKMTRMVKKAATARKNGRRGGNPSLSKQTENSSLDNQIHNQQLKPQKPEARSQKKKEEPNGSSKKGSRIDPAWEPSEEEISFAEGRGLGLETINLEAEKFRNYWLGKAGQAGVKLDWPATWRNWIIKAVERRGESGLPPPGPRSSRYDAIRRRMNDPAMIPPNVAGGSR